MEAVADVAAPPRTVGAASAVAVLVLVLACLRLSHVHLLWADEDYHVAAAIHMLHGKVPYRDFWYDKPPLSAVYYLLIGGHVGWALRFLDAGYIVSACWLAYRVASAWWSQAEGLCAAILLAFFTTFYLPSAVIPFAADALMIVPHLAAIDCAYRKRPLWAGVWSGVAFLVNAKALFVLAVCAVWSLSGLPLLLLGFVLPVLAGFVAAIGLGAWQGYVEQVWRWGLIYAEQSPVTRPFRLGLVRTSDWLGFHAAIAIGAAYMFARDRSGGRWRLGAWLLFSYAAACLGTRFAPHYFLQVLPPMVIGASRGVVLGWRERRRVAGSVLALTLLVPFVRFGPRYVTLAFDDLRGREPQWSDVAMDEDSRAAAAMVRSMSKPGDTLFVWGYRPDLYVYTRMTTAGKFWDSQPLTGVPADRHLSASMPIYGGPAAANREQLVQSHPTFIVDGLGLMNPKLKPEVYPEVRSWLSGYQLVGQTKLCRVFRRIP